jgi:hypothetical protein
MQASRVYVLIGALVLWLAHSTCDPEVSGSTVNHFTRPEANQAFHTFGFDKSLPSLAWVKYPYDCMRSGFG